MILKRILACVILLAVSFSAYAITDTFTPTITGTSTPTVTPTISQTATPTPTLEVQAVASNEMELSANVFNPRAGQNVAIEFSVAQAGSVIITIYNIAGLKVRTLNEYGLQPNIFYTSQAAWDGTADDGMEVASGVYYIKLKSGTAFEIVKKVIVLNK